MYGSIMRVRIKEGQKEAYERLLREIVPSADDYGRGLHSLELAWEDSDSQRAVMVIHFRDRESYVANAERPETDADYRRQAEFFDGEPEWIDVHWGDFVGNALTPTVASATA